MADHLDTFLTAVRDNLKESTFVKLTLGSYRGGDANLRKVMIRPVTLSRGEHLSFVYRHATKDVTKNVPVAEAPALLRTMLGTDFLAAHLFTTKTDIELAFNKKGQTRLRTSKPSDTAPPAKEHNRPKRRPIPTGGAVYLSLLGVTSKDGSVNKGREAKYRQINKFVEIVANLIRSSPLKNADRISVLDMGCGKGYLTFAVYDFLTHKLNKHANVTGVEVRQELVDLCNGVAAGVGFADLRFQCGTIQDYTPGPTDMVIALHACDTATDEALFKAIKADASLVLCAPCCHKELRPQVRCGVPGLVRVLHSGILLERQAELVTDGLRALLLEACGYKTTVFEFIATEHTSKNIMIAGIKTAKTRDPEMIRRDIEALKSAFGIRHQAMEAFLNRPL
jgi:SAM-dependent methyltransferase